VKPVTCDASSQTLPLSHIPFPDEDDRVAIDPPPLHLLLISIFPPLPNKKKHQCMHCMFEFFDDEEPTLKQCPLCECPEWMYEEPHDDHLYEESLKEFFPVDPCKLPIFVCPFCTCRKPAEFGQPCSYCGCVCYPLTVAEYDLHAELFGFEDGSRPCFCDANPHFLVDVDDDAIKDPFAETAGFVPRRLVREGRLSSKSALEKSLFVHLDTSQDAEIHARLGRVGLNKK